MVAFQDELIVRQGRYIDQPTMEKPGDECVETPAHRNEMDEFPGREICQ
jgi:hypothetical protein